MEIIIVALLFVLVFALVIGMTWVEAWIIVWIAGLLSISIPFNYVFFIMLVINFFIKSGTSNKK